MASLYFTYSAMNAGKSTSLLQVAHNYEERDQHVLLLTPALDTRGGRGRIHSRLGIEREAATFTSKTNLFQLVSDYLTNASVDCVLLDEAQFLTVAQVWELARVADILNVPVMCYGIRTDAFGEAFDGSAVLLAIADKLVEMKTICHCGRKATMSLRVDKDGRAVGSGEKIAIGGNDRYVSCCRKHWLQALQDAGVQPSILGL
ncbi:thymidine kinase [Aliidiomarina sedimenti]|uniref:Thymidine kinase n=2 Tax=Aliidiomarina TaxID=1249554 RepID=A0A432WJQ7_9GAMM|nr:MULTISPECIES: thymidine kinase [Aliidiomarina]RUO30622.1 thymidine kinase [Aliidiomarina sedimenti]RUO34004.1 thymidine kinase [Aliidiomarina soli]